MFHINSYLRNSFDRMTIRVWIRRITCLYMHRCVYFYIVVSRRIGEAESGQHASLVIFAAKQTHAYSHSIPLYLCYGDSGLCFTLIFCFPSKYGTLLRPNLEFFVSTRSIRHAKTLTLHARPTFVKFQFVNLLTERIFFFYCSMLEFASAL